MFFCVVGDERCKPGDQLQKKACYNWLLLYRRHLKIHKKGVHCAKSTFSFHLTSLAHGKKYVDALCQDLATFFPFMST